MSKVRPYLVTVGAQEYMIRATNQGQAINIAVKAHPMPVANAVAATADEVASWALAGKPIHTKDDFSPILPPTLVLFVTDDGKMAAPENLLFEPGNYFLTLERLVPESDGGEPGEGGDDLQPTGDAGDADEQDQVPLSPAPAINEPTLRGAFKGDVFYGDPLDSTKGTHTWSDGEWHRIPLT